MTNGAWVEAVIIRVVRAMMALFMLPLILLYAAVACVVYPVALVVTIVSPGDSRLVKARVAT